MKDIINIIKNGGVVIMPTDTIYGIIALATNEDSINKVFSMKQRNENKPMLMLVNGLDMLNKYVIDVNDVERKIINNFWPGPLTIIFKKKNISDKLTGGLDTIGIRYPDNEMLINIMNVINEPLLSTSVNVSGNESAKSIELIDHDILKQVDYVYDNGICNNEASSIVQIVNGSAKMFREGIVKESEIIDVIKN